MLRGVLALREGHEGEGPASRNVYTELNGTKAPVMDANADTEDIESRISLLGEASNVLCMRTHDVFLCSRSMQF